ncbi:transcriptional regulator [Nocardioides gansuensis]|uniref:Transcriptional regulator n=1 Tax=Nocardioides gansuensis TaxID=2138300 RepID=A0A2T8FDM0_9ACTN|nr:helix-turn-helix transcriptional regulator [Nocardioides gansuensis]PVG83807.1 transcriptional regulator [Nocardioides gansuensis]
MSTPLGEYLRARRAQVTPQEVGVPTHGVRRVPGLRREEVAMLAGVSVDYYTRLEQGRERSPSPQVLDALSDVLRLDDDARLHLYRVAGLTPGERQTAAHDRVAPELLRLLDNWSAHPAIVVGRAYDVLACNPLADALFQGFHRERNLMLRVFLDPDAPTFYPDWDQVARATVAGFRLLAGRTPNDPRIREVIAQLTRHSPAFVTLWQRHEARAKRLESKRLRHPEVGELTLSIQAFDVRSAPGQELIVYSAEPGTPSADGLALLGTLAATRDREARQA